MRRSFVFFRILNFLNFGFFFSGFFFSGFFLDFSVMPIVRALTRAYSSAQFFEARRSAPKFRFFGI